MILEFVFRYIKKGLYGRIDSHGSTSSFCAKINSDYAIKVLLSCRYKHILMKKYILLSFFIALVFSSQSQTITTVAGGNGQGSAADQFNEPSDVFVDSLGNVYVADGFNNRIQMFTAGSDTATDGVTVAGGNGQGSAANQLHTPDGLYVDESGNIYVSDLGNNRIQKFPAGSTSATDGVTVAGGNGQGNAANQLYFPTGIYLDRSGNMYVGDAGNNRIQKFPAGSSSTTAGQTVAGGNGGGSNANQLIGPNAVYVTTNGDIYIVDAGNSRIQKFPAGSSSSTNGITVAGGNGVGAASNQLNGPAYLALDATGNIYVTDQQNDRVQKFASVAGVIDTNGVTVAGISGVGGSSPQDLDGPLGIRIDAHGNIYVADDGNSRIQEYSYGTNGIANIPVNQTIDLYPNPNTGAFTLRSNNSIGKQFTIYDMIGRIVAQQIVTSDKQSVFLKDISSGSYSLQITGSNKAIRLAIEN
jgi:sugar lactone lactonase YvrE